MNSHIRNLLAEIAAKHNTTVADILSTSRHREHVNARHEVYYRLHHERKYSAARIGSIFNRNHSVVMYAISRHSYLHGLPTRMKRDWYHAFKAKASARIEAKKAAVAS